MAAVPVSAIHPVSSGRNYAAFKLMVNHQRSTGSGACDGCNTPMCIQLDAIRLVQPRVHQDVELTTGTPGMGGASNIVTWQGGTATCGAGAAKAATWSELKRRFHTP